MNSKVSTNAFSILFIQRYSDPLNNAMKTDFRAPETFSSVAVVVPAIYKKPVEESWSIEFISVSPEGNPKVRGNLRLEHDYPNTLMFVDSWIVRKVKKYNNEGRNILEVFRM